MVVTRRADAPAVGAGGGRRAGWDAFHSFLWRTPRRVGRSVGGRRIRPAWAEVWLHNRGPDDMGKVRLRCSDLLAHDGHVDRRTRCDSSRTSFRCLARCSRGVTVEVDVAEDSARKVPRHAAGRWSPRHLAARRADSGRILP